MALGFVFPGQGSQKVGMGKELAEAFGAARQVFEEVDDALELRLSRLMFEGPEDTLTLTENAQPALLAVSMAALRVVLGEGGHKLGALVSHVAGHSLGEYSALAAANALPLDVAARLVRDRGRAMQEAVAAGEGAMAAVLGLEIAALEDIVVAAAEDEVCAVANDNAPGQVVVSGHAGAVERAVALAKDAGARRALMLPVSAPFHSPLMAPAAEVMVGVLGEVAIGVPDVPVVANVTAKVAGAGEIKDLLVAQVTGRVRWRESVLEMREQGVDRFVELGAGAVLTGLVRRIDRDLSAASGGTPAQIDAIMASL